VSDLLTSLSSASRALDAQRYGMDVTGQNIANANTPGYSRRTIDLAAVAPYEPGSAGGGVDVVSVRALRDRLLDRKLRQELPSQQRESAKADSLSVIESTIGLPGKSIDAKLQSFFDSFSKLANDPTSAVARQEVLQQATGLAGAFNDMSQRLTDSQTDADTQVRASVDQINTIVTQLGKLNASASSVASTGGLPALQDQQGQLVRQLSALTNVQVLDQGNGVINVSFGNGRPLVVGETTYPVGVTSTAPTGYAQITSGGTTVTSEITGGKLAGYLQMRDANIPAYKSQLDTLAYTVAQQVNAAHSAGYDQTGAAGGNFFAPLGSATGAAAAIAVDPAITSDLKKIAAAGIAEAGDNQNARRLSALGSATVIGSGTMTDAWSQLVYTVGRDSKAAQDEQASLSQVVDQIDTLRDQVSGVSLDEEATNLLKFQRAYEANAKFFAACNQAIDVLMQNLT
jgi:flagellar hook-associated protein 1 FlgK